MRALLLDDASDGLLRGCAGSGFTVTRVPSVARGRALLARGGFDLVDGRIARPAPLEEEILSRLDLFYERLKGHSYAGLYQAILREVERPLITAALKRARGVQSETAKALGIDRGTLARRMKALGISP
jgi:Fis family transcriptional regulator, factor for inversion stimulation protein